MRILMCRPDYYGILYEINPWMNKDNKVNHESAMDEWDQLYRTILSCGAQIDLISPIKGWPDMVFTANAGLFYKNKIILPHFKYVERQGELPYFQNWFTQAGFDIANTVQKNSPYFEGTGDALPMADKLFAGYGFRSEQKFYEQAAYLDQSKLIYCELIDPYFYHLDTCFCPINDELAIWYPEAFTPDTQKRMSQEIELLPVIKQEAKNFACNAVVINQHIILPAHCPQISAVLERYGLTIHACVMDEYLKAGGACKCLTLRLD